MIRKSVVPVLLALAVLLLAACGKEKKETNNEGNAQSQTILSVEDYMSDLTEEKTAHLKAQTDLLLHPLKDAIEIYGNDYEFSYEGYYVSLSYPEAGCTFKAYIGDGFDPTDEDNYEMDLSSDDAMEYLSFSEIESVIFDTEAVTLTDGITVGMSSRQISEKLDVSGIDYKNSCSMITTEQDENGNDVNLYYISGELSHLEYTVIFSGDVLSYVEIANYSGYLFDEEASSDKGKQIIEEAFSFVSENESASFSSEDLSYLGKSYSSFYDSWFYRWQFYEGDYKGYEINVEQDAPHRVYVTAGADCVPMVFWCDGRYVDPVLSFYGKWRDYGNENYIDIKSISKEGIVVFDMYTYVYDMAEMVLIENLNTAINDMPKTLDDYIFYQSIDESLDGDIQLYNGEVQSGCYSYGGDKNYLIDSFFMKLDGSVCYLPRGMGGRVTSGTLPIHIPSKDYDYTQPFSWGYMEAFGRDDPNPDSVIYCDTPEGAEIIDKYLNKKYETVDLKYTELDYTYLYDYVFSVNDVVYKVWKSNDEEFSHYLYVDCKDELIIMECEFSKTSKHSKELVFKAGQTVSMRSCLYKKYSSSDGKITIDFENKTITKTDSFIKDVEIPELYMDTVGSNMRFMFFSGAGNRFALNGYVLFDITTWGATLHITDSNVPNFEAGVYYLGGESFLLDPSITVLNLPEDQGKDIYIDDKIDEMDQDTKLVIRDLGGKIIGYVYIDVGGKKTVRNYHGKILGYYYPDRNVTTDVSGKILARGDIASGLLFS